MGLSNVFVYLLNLERAHINLEVLYMESCFLAEKESFEEQKLVCNYPGFWILFCVVCLIYILGRRCGIRGKYSIT